MIGRELLRELFDLKLDQEFTLFPVTEVVLPVDFPPDGNQHAYYLKSVIVTSPAVTQCAEAGAGATVEYSEVSTLVNGRLVKGLLVRNNGAVTVTGKARVYRVQGLADT